MNKQDYLKLRRMLYDSIGYLGYDAELASIFELNEAYKHASTTLDYIDELGIKLGYIDSKNNEVN